MADRKARILDFDGVPDPLDGKVGIIMDEDETGITLFVPLQCVYRLSHGEYEVLEG